MTAIKEIYDTLKLKMEEAGFQFEKEQRPFFQNRKELELKFVHPHLIKKFKDSNLKTRVEKFYIKPLTNDANSEVGLVAGGKTSPLLDESFFPKPNTVDSRDGAPAWTNRKDENSLDNLLETIKFYLNTFTNTNNIENSLLLVESDYSKDGTIAVNQETFREGKLKEIVQIGYERSSKAREECLKHYGHSCKICDFNFEEIFGESGKGFIHVHHLNPIAEIGTEYEVDPKNDLIPVCPNCHAMIHSRKPAYSIEEVVRFRTTKSDSFFALKASLN